MSDDPNAAGNLKLRGASATKPPLGIVPMHPLVGVARVLEDSGIKYAPFNYMTQPTIDALEAYDSGELRHRLASTLLGGQVTPESYAALDPDSGIPHIYHRIAGLLILASLMIRDGLLSADPGMGKRKRAAFEGTQRPRPTVGDNYPLGEPAREDAPTNTPALPERDDPDAERRAAADAHVEQLRREQATLAEQKRKWEQRCLLCNGTGKIEHDPDERGTCHKCNGTGQRTGAEGVRR